MAETLKYFYLLFSDPDTVSLDDFGKFGSMVTLDMS